MENTKNTKVVATKKTTNTKEKKVMNKKVKNEVAVVETKVVKKENKKKENVSLVKIMDNDTLKKLFQDNGCKTRTNASNSSNVVYNTFGTQSRILQQKRGYQLLLTNGHANSKGNLVECDNDDTKRFIEWYEKLSEEQKASVNGYSELTQTKLSMSEMPRERTVKITSYDLLVDYIKYMATFEENAI